MESLKINPETDTPEVLLQIDGNIRFSGNSLPENGIKFYQPIISWLEEYVQDPKEQTQVEFQLEYFNTISSKKIYDVLNVLTSVKNRGKDLRIKWYYRNDDDDMKEAGEEYEELVATKFEFIENYEN